MAVLITLSDHQVNNRMTPFILILEDKIIKTDVFI